jgi:ribosomal protein S18 acetylase RimI-like enzyme
VIKRLNIEDSQDLFDFISQRDTGYEVDVVKEIQTDGKNVFIYKDTVIKGFANFTLSIDAIENKRAEIKIYVDPDSRRQGIGSALYQELLEHVTREKPDVLIAYIRVDIEDTSPFCKNYGFRKWWGSPELFYRGQGFPDVDGVFSHYEDKFYEQYREIKNDCYYEIQVTNDIHPYISPPSVAERTELQRNKENIYLVLDNDQIMASVTIGKGTIDNLMVNKTYQGRGLGKKSMQFAMNHLLNNGYDEIRICYMEGNTKAEKLYHSLGFKPLMKTHVYRKFL